EATGYWMLDMKNFDNDPQNNNVIDNVGLEAGVDTIVKFNPRYVHCNMDRIGFPPHKIVKKWEDSIMKKVTVIDSSTSEPVETIVKVDNLLDGFSTLAAIFEDIFS